MTNPPSGLYRIPAVAIGNCGGVVVKTDLGRHALERRDRQRERRETLRDRDLHRVIPEVVELGAAAESGGERLRDLVVRRANRDAHGSIRQQTRQWCWCRARPEFQLRGRRARARRIDTVRAPGPRGRSRRSCPGSKSLRPTYVRLEASISRVPREVLLEGVDLLEVQIRVLEGAGAVVSPDCLEPLIRHQQVPARVRPDTDRRRQAVDTRDALVMVRRKRPSHGRPRDEP